MAKWPEVGHDASRSFLFPLRQAQGSACPFSIRRRLGVSGPGALWAQPTGQPRACFCPEKAPHLSLPFRGAGLRSGLGGKGTQLPGPQKAPDQQCSDFPPRRREVFASNRGQQGRPWLWLPCCSLALLSAGSCFILGVSRISESLVCRAAGLGTHSWTWWSQDLNVGP